MEATCSSEASVDFQRTTRLYIPEDLTLHNHRCENLKSYTGLQIIFIVEDGVYKTILSVPGSRFSGMDVTLQLIGHPDIFILTSNSETMQCNDPPCTRVTNK
jgi:hypothetical protein